MSLLPALLLSSLLAPRADAGRHGACLQRGQTHRLFGSGLHLRRNRKLYKLQPYYEMRRVHYRRRSCRSNRSSDVGSAASPKVSPGTYIALRLQRNTVYNRFTHGCYALRNAVINVVRCSLRRHLIKGRGNHVHLRTGNLRVYAPVWTYKRCVHKKV